uniref:GOST seven transmembrane domain-containing protein n=1 Tax=Arcella intermedia TaxID=1963864 RepID=A0A6B2L5J8_9EUKA
MDKVGQDYSLWSGSRSYCCTSSLFKAGGCPEVGVMTIKVPKNPSENGYYLHYANLTLAQYTKDEASFSNSLELKHTGQWYFVLANCGAEGDEVTLEIDGSVEFKNPFGYIGGESFGYIYIYWIFTALYVLVALWWGYATYKHNKDMVMVQHLIGFVIGISIFENLIWAGDYTIYNINGVVHPIANIFGAIFSSCSLTSIRLLVLLVALGFKVTKPTLKRKQKLSIIVLMTGYFIVEASQEYIAVAEASGEQIQNSLKITMSLFLGITEMIVLGWIGWSLRLLYKNPLLAFQPEKQALYKHTIILLLATISLSLLAALLEFFFELFSNHLDLWRFLWIFGTYWEIVYFGFLLTIVAIWLPTDRNTKLSYGKVQVVDGEEVEELELESSEEGDEGNL